MGHPIVLAVDAEPLVPLGDLADDAFVAPEGLADDADDDDTGGDGIQLSRQNGGQAQIDVIGCDPEQTAYGQDTGLAQENEGQRNAFAVFYVSLMLGKAQSHRRRTEAQVRREKETEGDAGDDVVVTAGHDGADADDGQEGTEDDRAEGAHTGSQDAAEEGQQYGGKYTHLILLSFLVF